MPRYYCDYCDTYLTHDSPSVRKQHNAGYKHKANVRAYYQQFEEQQTQSLIDQKVKEHLGQAAAYHQVGSSFHHHFGAMQSGQYRPPTLPIPTSAQALNNPAMRHRPPVFPRPNIGPPGYSGVPSVASSFRPPGAPVSPTSHTSTPGFPGLRQATPSSAMANAPISTSKNTGTYQIQQPNSFPTSGLGAYGTYSNVLPPAGFSQQGTAYVLPNHIYEEAPRVAPYALSDSSMPSNAAQGNYIYNQIPTSAPCNESTAKPAASPPGTS